MVVLNSSADVRVPLQVTVGGQQQGLSQTSGPAAPAFDTATVTGLVGLASALAYRWKKSNKHEDRFDDRTTTSAQTIMQGAESLKQTDKGIEETLGSIVKAVGLIPGVPPDAVKLVSDQLEAWHNDNQAYYENAPAKPTDLSKDPIVKKLGEIQKITEKNG
jgi:hypothetical protein